MRFGAPAPDELLVWKMVLDTGWTLDYIDSLSIKRIHEYIQVKDGTSKARK